MEEFIKFILSDIKDKMNDPEWVKEYKEWKNCSEHY